MGDAYKLNKRIDAAQQVGVRSAVERVADRHFTPWRKFVAGLLARERGDAVARAQEQRDESAANIAGATVDKDVTLQH